MDAKGKGMGLDIRKKGLGEDDIVLGKLFSINLVIGSVKITYMYMYIYESMYQKRYLKKQALNGIKKVCKQSF